MKPITIFILLLLPVAALVQAQTPIDTLKHPQPQAGSGFGNLIIPAGNDVLIAALNLGEVYLFDGTTGDTLRTYRKRVRTSGDGFGSAIAVVGDTVLIGAPLDDVRRTNDGAVYLFHRNSNFPFDTLFSTSEVGDTAYFGQTLAAIRGVAMIGAPRENFGSTITDAGAVYLQNIRNGVRLARIPNPDPGVTDRFGTALAATAFNFIVGTPSDAPGNLADRGSVYVFDAAGAPRPFSPLLGEAAGSAFGYAVSAADKNIIVSNQFLRRAYVFDGDNGAVLDTLPDPFTSFIYFFGSAVAGTSTKAYVAARGNASIAGVVYEYTIGSNALPTIIRNPTGNNDELFASSVAILSGKVLVGAPLANSAAGAVYVFGPLQQPPRLVALADTSVVEGKTLSLPFSASDPDKHTILFTAKNLPPFGSLTDNGNGSGQITFAPPFNSAGVYANIMVIARDNGVPSLTDTSTFTLTVLNQQRPPQIGPLPNLQMFAGAILSVPVTASDPDTDAVFFSGRNLPPFARLQTLRSGQAVLRFTPNRNAAATYSNITIIATDNGNPALSDSTSFTLAVLAATDNVVLNEISFAPNYDDLGYERIELKNAGTNAVALGGWRLWVRRDALDTFWSFPAGASLAPGNVAVVHWLAARFERDETGAISDDKNDAGNLFTGLPESGGFSGNNSSSSIAMKLGGPNDGNLEAFTIALLQGPPPGSQFFSERLADFVQAAGVVSASQAQAAAAGLWQRGDFLDNAGEGFSYELRDTPGDSFLTTAGDYFAQASPSLGFRNKLAAPPAQHLLISEVCVAPNSAEFVEIYNPTSTPISLRQYYLTDNVNSFHHDYARLVKGSPDSLLLASGDFVVKFPDTAAINPGQYKTIALNGRTFQQRFNALPAYEILGADASAANDMQIIKRGAERLALDDNEEALILLRWDGQSDLVEDVDYFVWGFDGKFIPHHVNKTPLGIDGADSNSAVSYFDRDTDQGLQKPVKDNGHELLKSWQRLPRSVPEETGELAAGGNGISGHDETSEDLSKSFVEGVPTPDRPSKELALEFDFALVFDTLSVGPGAGLIEGNRDGIVDRGEKFILYLQLRNLSLKGTNDLFSILRSKTPEVSVGPDSVAIFNPIAPNEVQRSVDFYELLALDTPLPTTITLDLLVIDKAAGSADTAHVTVNLIANIKLDPASSRLVVADTTLLFFFRLTNNGTTAGTNLGVRFNLDGAGSSPLRKLTYEIPCNGPDTSCTLNARARIDSFQVDIKNAPASLLNGSALSGCVKVASTKKVIAPPPTFAIAGNDDPQEEVVLTQNGNLAINYTLPRVAVAVEYLNSRVLVPDIVVTLEETNAQGVLLNTLKSDTTDTLGRVELFNLPIASHYRIRLSPVAGLVTDPLAGISFVDVDSCDAFLTPSANPSSPKIMLADINADGRLTAVDADMIDIFTSQTVMDTNFIGRGGGWLFMKKDNTFSSEESFQLANGSNKFISFKAYRIGDLNTSWLPRSSGRYPINRPRPPLAPIVCGINPQ